MSALVPPAPSLHLLPASELAPRPLSWLWPGRLALGKLGILDGDPGLGKSLVALDLCARLSTGRPFPACESAALAPASAIVFNGEDSPEETIRPRLQALGADLARVFVFDRHADSADPPSFPSHASLLDEALARTGARLVVIDPIMAFLDPRIASSSDQSVRRALLPLADLAEKHSCAVLLLRHLNKSGTFRSIYRGGGSIGLLGACRSGWLIARDPTQPDRCVLAQVKNNLAAVQPSLVYTVSAPQATIPTLTWLGPCDWSADGLLGRPSPGPAPRPRDVAEDFLSEFLRNGPRTSREIWTAAQEKGLTRRTLERAKRELEIRSVRGFGDSQPLSYWLLPGQQLPLPAGSAAADLEEWLEPLRRQFPPPTPIDEL
jgi:hypothetical protein